MNDKKVIGLGVTAGIAAYKTINLASKLSKNNYKVIPILTKNSLNFITPLAFQTVSGNRVFYDQFELVDNYNPEHISIARECDLIMIAPATADIIAKLAAGIADELLLSVVTAFKNTVIIVPSMNPDMYNHPAVKKNIKILKEYGYKIIEPGYGYTACGEVGPGRMPEPEILFEIIESEIGRKYGKLKGKRVLMTTGPTVEMLDTMRYISNLSSGLMGKAISDSLIREGAEVNIVAGPGKTEYSSMCEIHKVENAEEMFKKVKTLIKKADIFISAAAVSDYRPAEKSSNKKDKKDRIKIELVSNKDILKWVSDNYFGKKLLVGFSASDDINTIPLKKIKNKPVDILIVNPIGKKNLGPGSIYNSAVLYDKNGVQIDKADNILKKDLADIIIKNIIKNI